MHLHLQHNRHTNHHRRNPSTVSKNNLILNSRENPRLAEPALKVKKSPSFASIRPASFSLDPVTSRGREVDVMRCDVPLKYMSVPAVSCRALSSVFVLSPSVALSSAPRFSRAVPFITIMRPRYRHEFLTMIGQRLCSAVGVDSPGIYRSPSIASTDRPSRGLERQSEVKSGVDHMWDYT